MQTQARHAAPRCDAEGWHHFRRNPWFMARPVTRTSGAPDLFYTSKTHHCQQYICQTFLFTQVWMFGREQKTVIAASRWCNWLRCVGSALLIWVKAYAKCPYWRVTEPSMPWPHRQHPSLHWQACWCVQHDSKATLLLLCVMSPKDTSKHRGAACLRKLRLSWDNRWLQASHMPVSQYILVM